MALYIYQAVDPEGTSVEGTIEEVSALRATAVLRERGLQVNRVEEQTKSWSFLQRQRPLTWEDVNLLNEQLLAITESGLPLAPALRALAKDLRNRRLRRVLEDIRARIEQGDTIEQAMAMHPASFPPMYLSLIRAGERTGNLSGVLSQLAAYSGRMIELKHRFQVAVAYPLVVLAASCVVIAFLLLKVVPMFAEIYDDFGLPLPAITRFWLAIGNAAQDNGHIIVAIAIFLALAAIVLAQLAIRNETVRYGRDWLKLRLPGLGGVYHAVSMARLCRSFGLLLAGRVPGPEALELAGASAGNAVFEGAATQAARCAAEGDTLSHALSEEGIFDHTFCWMVQTAEEREDVETALFRLADGYERDLARKDALIGLLTGPVLILMVGAVVLSLLISVYYPIVGFAYAWE